MAVDVIMPQMGESIFEGTITKWLKKPGDKIERDEPLFEISTDKVDAEIPSPAAGVLKEIKVKEGQTVPIQTVVASIDATGSSAAAPASAPAKPKRPRQRRHLRPKRKRRNPLPHRLHRVRLHPLLQQPPRHRKTDANGDKIRSSPLVRRMAREHNIDLSQVPGTGAGGRISKQDILAATEGGATSCSSGGRRSSAPVAPAGGPPCLRRRPAASGRLNRPSRAKKCTSATTMSSRCPPCGRKSPSTW